jgi:hypothetical protein
MSPIHCFYEDKVPEGRKPTYPVEAGLLLFMYRESPSRGPSIASQKVQAGNFSPPLLAGLSAEEVEVISTLLLLRATQNRERRVDSMTQVENLARSELTKYNKSLILSRILSHQDHPLIPQGHYLAVTEPRILGRRVIHNDGVSVFLSYPAGVLHYYVIPS